MSKLMIETIEQDTDFQSGVEPRTNLTQLLQEQQAKINDLQFQIQLAKEEAQNTVTFDDEYQNKFVGSKLFSVIEKSVCSSLKQPENEEELLLQLQELKNEKLVIGIISARMLSKQNEEEQDNLAEAFKEQKRKLEEQIKVSELMIEQMKKADVSKNANANDTLGKEEKVDELIESTLGDLQPKEVSEHRQQKPVGEPSIVLGTNLQSIYNIMNGKK